MENSSDLTRCFRAGILGCGESTASGGSNWTAENGVSGEAWFDACGLSRDTVSCP